MTVTVSQQTELERPSIRVAYFVELDFSSAPVRLCSAGQDLIFNNQTWMGVGNLGEISDISEESGSASSGMQLVLNVVVTSFLALSIGNVYEYRGRTAKIYFCPLDENYRLVGEPVICWRGTMDVATVSMSGSGGEAAGSVTINCETSAYGLKKGSSLRINHAQQSQKYPTDKGLEYLTDLISNPDSSIWLSSKFQSRQ